MDDRGLHRSDGWRLSQKFLGDRAVDCHRAVDPPHDHGVLDRVIAIVHSPEAPSDGGEDSWKKPTIMVRSWFVHRGINATIHGAQFQLKTPREKSTIDARSPRDQGLIAA